MDMMRDLAFHLCRFYIQEFSQRGAGLQTLGAQLFTASDLPLTSVDFGDNQGRNSTDI